MLSVSKLLHHMGRVFQEEAFPKTGPVGMQIDRKRMEQLQEKRAAHGLKGNVYEGFKGPSMGGMGGMSINHRPTQYSYLLYFRQNVLTFFP